MRVLSKLFRKLIRTGTLFIVDVDGKEHRFGDGGPCVRVRLHDRSLYWKLVVQTELYAGEAYMDGTLTIESGDLSDLFRLYYINQGDTPQTPLAHLRARLQLIGRYLAQFNPSSRSHRNAAHHYDLSRELYALFLDRDLQYSCAYFPTGTESLEEAQMAKKRLIATKLCLEPGNRVLDIGCGWGGMALTLARMVPDSQILGITLSKEQLAVARDRARAAGLQDRVRFDLLDYRQVEGTFDRIVSVGMFEHVGVPHYDRFFRVLRERLTENGVALLHSIGHRSPPTSTSRWLTKYIFPGGYAPALSETIAAVERSALWITDVEVLRMHYARTLRHWMDRFDGATERARTLYDDRFIRMWEFYLKACEAVFLYGDELVFQMQITRRRDAVPLTRDYIIDGQRELAVTQMHAAQ